MPLRILIADDLPDAADSLALLLRAHGHSVHVVYDGASAVHAVANLIPQVAIVDIGMPVLDGCEVCLRIRALESGQGMFVIALTGWGRDVDRRRTAAAGFDRHLVKPVDFRLLVDLLEQLERRESQPG